MKAVFDTNILIDHLCGQAQAAAFWSSYTDRVISRITFMEVLAGADTTQEKMDARTLLSGFRIVELDGALSERVIALRKSHHKKIKLPDAIIYATAKLESCALLTRNTGDFDATARDVIAPYTLSPP